MARMISVHEYELKPGIDPGRFEQTLRDAGALGPFDLPGLISYHFVKGAGLAQPYTTGGGKTVNVRVHRADNPSVMAIRTWGAHERVSVKRESAAEGKP